MGNWYTVEIYISGKIINVEIQTDKEITLLSKDEIMALVLEEMKNQISIQRVLK